MNKIKTLKKKREFDFVYRNSIKYKKEFFDLYMLKQTMINRFYAKFKNYNGYIIFGLSVSKKIGGAVERNLIKRRLKHIIRDITKYLSLNTDIILIVVARNGIKDASFEILKNSINNVVSK